MPNSDFQYCEECRQPSTVFIQDMQQLATGENGWERWEPFGDPHFYCKIHIREPRRLRTT